jgi:stalled ribosome alternative rescue factor ArfA
MGMKSRKRIKARVSPQGFMGSASREHRVKKGKGSFRRNAKHKANCE